jgi:K+-sensing histidine kinase KdpD
MSGIDDRHSLSDGPDMPEAGLHRFWPAPRQFLFGITGLALITFAAVQFHVRERPLPASVGPGTNSLLYLIIIVFVSLSAGFVCSAALSLIAVVCLNYFSLRPLSSLMVKNPLEIVAAVAFLFVAWAITGAVARVRKLTKAQLTLRKGGG